MGPELTRDSQEVVPQEVMGRGLGAKLCGLNCERILQALVDTSFLFRFLGARGSNAFREVTMVLCSDPFSP